MCAILPFLIFLSIGVTLACLSLPSSLGIPRTVCCDNQTLACRLTSSYVSILVLNASGFNYSLTIANGQTLSLGGTNVAGQASSYGGPILVETGGTLWIGQVPFYLRGDPAQMLLSMQEASVLHITNNASIHVPGCTNLNLSRVDLLLDLDPATNNVSTWVNNTPAALPIVIYDGNSSSICDASAAFENISASLSVVNIQTGVLQVVWTSLSGAPCQTDQRDISILFSGNCAPPPAPPAASSYTTLGNASNNATTSNPVLPADETISGYIILIAVAAFVFLAMLVTAILLFKCHPGCRRWVAPFRDRPRYESQTQLHYKPRVAAEKGPRVKHKPLARGYVASPHAGAVLS